MNRLQSRSPYLIYHTETDLTSVIIEIYLYEGTKTTSRPITPNIALEVEAYDDKIVVDISQYVEDYIDVNFSGNYDSNMIWVDYQLTPYVLEVAQTPETLVALEGYLGYRDYTEGAQNISFANDEDKILMSTRIIYKPKDAHINIPIIADSSYSYMFVDSNGYLIHEGAVVNSSLSTSKMIYINDTASAGVDSFKDRVLVDGGIFEGSAYLEDILCLDSENLKRVSVGDEIIEVKNFPETIDKKYKVTFINKFGALQDIWFTGKSSVKLKVEAGNSYRRNILSNDSYNISSHNRITQTKNGVETLSISTGFVDESYNEVFKQLLLSKYVWVEVENMTLPLNITDSGLTYKTSVNDKLIAFKIEAEFSFNTLGNIR